MVVCLVFDIDDTIYENKTTQIIYDTIQQDYELYQLMKRIHLPKFVLTNAVYEHANIIINKLGIENLMRKVYARDNMNYMKPHIECYKAVNKDISKVVRSDDNKYIFFDDLLENLETAKQLGWSTVWINPKFHEGNNYSYVDRSFRTLKDALKELNF